MKRVPLFVAAVASAIALGGTGCGVDETVYNAAVKARDAAPAGPATPNKG